MRIHVNLRVQELGESIGFYSKLFDTEPTVLEAGYAKWQLEEPRVNFSIVEGEKAAGALGVEHLGIEAENVEELQELRRRVDTMQGEVLEEGPTVCCYHSSDKTWITDAQGVSWENFHTTGRASEMYEPSPAGRACCDTGSCSVENSGAESCGCETERAGAERCCA